MRDDALSQDVDRDRDRARRHAARWLVALLGSGAVYLALEHAMRTLRWMERLLSPGGASILALLAALLFVLLRLFWTFLAPGLLLVLAARLVWPPTAPHDTPSADASPDAETLRDPASRRDEHADAR